MILPSTSNLLVASPTTEMRDLIQVRITAQDTITQYPRQCSWSAVKEMEKKTVDPYQLRVLGDGLISTPTESLKERYITQQSKTPLKLGKWTMSLASISE